MEMDCLYGIYIPVVAMTSNSYWEIIHHLVWAVLQPCKI
jgi:hypothetical protein